MSADFEDIFSAFDDKPVDPPPKEKFLPGFPGRANPAPYTLQKAAKEFTNEALEMMVNLMRFSEEDSIKLEAAKQILDRGWGKPSLKVQAETIQYTLQDVEAKLLEHRDSVEAKIIEARNIENDRLARYIVDDAEIIDDFAAHCSSSLQDNS